MNAIRTNQSNQTLGWIRAHNLSLVPGDLSVDYLDCPEHGRQGVGLVCTHILDAIDFGEPVGFFWGDDTDTARPDAWCRECEEALLAVPEDESTEDWFLACDFKVLCAACWDLAKQRIYESHR
jgi:hypothetical protein